MGLDRNARRRLLARKIRRRAQIIRLRDETHELVSSDGKRAVYRARIGRNLNFRPNPVDEPERFEETNLDLDLEDADGVGTDTGRARIRLPLVAGGRFVTRDRETGRIVEFRYLGASLTSRRKRIGRRAVVYRDAYPDTDLVVRATPTGAKVFWRFKGSGHPTKIVVRTEGLTDLEAGVEDGRVVYRDAKGVGRFGLNRVDLVRPAEPDPRVATPEIGTFGRIRWTLPDVSDLSYPFVFDPTSTFNPDADPETDTVDGYVQQTGSQVTFSTLVGGSGNGAVDNTTFMRARISADSSTDRYDLLRRIIVTFDTSSLPAGATIDSAKLRLYAMAGTFIDELGTLDFGVYNLASALASATSLSAGDFDAVGTTRLDTASHTTSSVVSDGYIEFPFNASGRGEVDTGGVSEFAVMFVADADDDDTLLTWATRDDAQISFSSAEGANSPELSVTYSTAVPVDPPDPETVVSVVTDGVTLGRTREVDASGSVVSVVTDGVEVERDPTVPVSGSVAAVVTDGPGTLGLSGAISVPDRVAEVVTDGAIVFGTAPANTKELVRLEIADASGTMQDMSDLDGVDWFDRVEISDSREQKMATAAIIAQREVPDPNDSSAVFSLVPELSARIARGRRVKVWAWVGDIDAATPADSEYTLVFDGYIDDPEWGGVEAEIRIPCRDLGAPLHDVWVEDVVERGSNGSPVPIATVIQQIIDAEFGSLAPTLEVEGTPDFGILAYNQQRESVFDAITTLAELIGWTVRYRRYADDEFRLTLFEQNPDLTNPQELYRTDDYFAVDEIRLETSEIRNVVIVEGTLANGNTYTVTVADDDSIAALAGPGDTGRRPLFIDAKNDPLLTTTTALDNLAASALRDTALPPFLLVVDQRFDPSIGVSDVVRYAPDDTYFDANKDVAAVSWTHVLSPTESFTTIRGRGAPAGGALRWIARSQQAVRRQRDQAATPSPTSSVVFGVVSPSVDPATGDLTARTSGTPAVSSWRIVASLSDISDATLEAATPIDGQSLSADDVGTLLASLEPSDEANVAAIPYSGTGGTGEAGARIDETIVFGVGTAGLPDDGVTADKLIASSKRFGFSGAFTTNGAQIQWGAGTLFFADGTTYSIASGSDATPAIRPAITYYYFSASASTTEIQHTDSLATFNGVSDGVLLATGWRTNTGTGASVVPAVGILSLDGENITPESIQTDRIGANAITAAKIDVASLNAIDISAFNINSVNFEAGFSITVESGGGSQLFLNNAQVRVESDDGLTLYGSFTGNNDGVKVEAFGLSRRVLVNAATVEILTATTGQDLAFFGEDGASQRGPYTPTNVTTDRSFDANSTTVAELADVVGTMIVDLQDYGLFG